MAHSHAHARNPHLDIAICLLEEARRADTANDDCLMLSYVEQAQHELYALGVALTLALAAQLVAEEAQ